MRVFVDRDNQTEPTEFAYTNLYGSVEVVAVFDLNLVTLRDAENNGLSDICIVDIPKLIKALQMAYDTAQKAKA